MIPRFAAAHVLVAAWLSTACGGDDAGDASGSGSDETTCSGAACGESTMSSATDETGSSSTATTIPPGDSSTSTDATSSSTGADACVTDTCTACFECTYDGECSDEQSLCSVDPACSVALICVRDCIAMSADPSDCLAACDCPKEGPLAALLGCATAICVPTGSCPPIAC